MRLDVVATVALLGLVTGCGAAESETALTGHGGSGGSGGNGGMLGSGGAFGGGGSGSQGGAFDCSLPQTTTGSAALDCVVSTPAAPPPSGDLARDSANREAFQFFEQMIGRYLRGEAAVYRGRIAAHDNLGAVVPGQIDQAMATEHAIASLGFELAGIEPAEVKATLVVFSPCEMKRIEFAQERARLGITVANGILQNEYGGQDPTCNDCAPDFFARPVEIDWTDQDAFYSDVEPPSPFHLVSSVSLERESPCRLTWNDLIAVDAVSIGNVGAASGLNGFLPQGEQMVLPITGEAITKDSSGHGICDGITVPYTAELYVNRTNVADYGIRKFVAGVEKPYCRPF